MLRNQDDKLPTFEEIDDAFENIEQSYYAERKYKIKRKLALGIIFFILVLIVFSLTYYILKSLDGIFFGLFITLLYLSSIFCFTIFTSIVDKKLLEYDLFSKNIKYINSIICFQLSRKIKDWIDGKEIFNIVQIFILLEHIKNKIYGNNFFFNKGKDILEKHKNDLAFADLDIKQLYFVGTLKAEIYELVYEYIDINIIVKNENLELLQSKFKILEIEFSKIKKMPNNNVRLEKVLAFIIGFKEFNFSKPDSYFKLRKFNYAMSGAINDIKRRRLKHTAIGSIKGSISNYLSSKSFFQSIELNERDYQFEPFQNYFIGLKSSLLSFDNYLNEYGIENFAFEFQQFSKNLIKQKVINESPVKPIIEQTINYINKYKDNHKEKSSSFNSNKKVNNANFNIIENDTSALQNTKIGLLGEYYILNYEKQKLKLLPLYANAIEHTSQVKGDGNGYDIKSFTEDGETIFIEVKTTVGDLFTNFFITKNEMEILKSNSNYYLYRVFEFDEKIGQGKLKIYKTMNQINNDFEISPISYSVKPYV